MTGSPEEPLGWRLRSDLRVFLVTLATGLPGLVLALVVLWRVSLPDPVRWLAALALGGAVVGMASAVAGLYRRPLETIANVLAALRVGDYSTRVRGGVPEDPAGLAFMELNELAEGLAENRLGGMEAGALLRAVLAEVDVAILAVDEAERIRFVNRSGAELLARSMEELEGMTVAEAGIRELLELDAPATVDRVGRVAEGRFDVRRGTFRQEGRPHSLFVVSDVSRALRQEERAAWRRLVRVLSHEINNSLAPIRSISGSLLDLLARVPAPPDRDADLRDGLGVIAARSDSLGRFMTAYARWARLPPPQKQRVDVAEWVTRIARLEPRLPVNVRDGAPATVEADPDQLDQLLINVLRNAVEASRETGGGVEVSWKAEGESLVVRVIDEGPGLSSTENLFVPFFTTKRGGSGIGLVLSRDIAEAHGGTLALSNRPDEKGCVATLVLPIGDV
jgi:nitrogen fixation/metabolism regulation signal transduction histidine kinase